MFQFIKNLFKHNCENHKTLLSCGWTKCGWTKCGYTGVIYNWNKKYVCDKCGKKWEE